MDPNHKKYDCQKCKKRFIFKSYYERHMKSSKCATFDPSTNDTMEIIENNENNSNDKTDDSKIVFVHEGQKRYRCVLEMCEKTFSNPFDLHLHIDFVHSTTQENNACDICEASFKRKDTLKCHTKNVHQFVKTIKKKSRIPEGTSLLKTKRCRVCNERFSLNKELMTHIAEKHDGQQGYIDFTPKDKKHTCRDKL